MKSEQTYCKSVEMLRICLVLQKCMEPDFFLHIDLHGTKYELDMGYAVAHKWGKLRMQIRETVEIIKNFIQKCSSRTHTSGPSDFLYANP